MTPRLPVRCSPRPLRAALVRFLGSTSLRGSVQAAYTPAVMSALFLLTVLIAVATRGEFITWTGTHPIPTEAGTR